MTNAATLSLFQYSCGNENPESYISKPKGLFADCDRTLSTTEYNKACAEEELRYISTNYAVDDWDNMGANAVDALAYKNALDFIRNSLDGWDIPSIDPTPNGDIQFQWDGNPNLKVIAGFDKDNKFYYYIKNKNNVLKGSLDYNSRRASDLHRIIQLI